MNIINEIREKQNQLIVMINSTFDEIIKKVEITSLKEMEETVEYESIYPITNTTGFKGKKCIAVIIDNQRIVTPTWKSVAKVILEYVLEQDNNESKMLKLCDKLLGRKRKRISNTEEGMRSPLMLRENLYVETHYDTETLMNLLLQILNEIKFDYSKISIAIKN